MPRDEGGRFVAAEAAEGIQRATAAFAGWELRDPLGRRVGRVGRVFLDGAGRAAHVEVSLGPFGTRTVLLPVGGVRADKEARALFLEGGRGRRPHSQYRAAR